MIDRANFRLVLSIGVTIFFTTSTLAEGERWSRQVSSSEWIPLANPRNQQSQSSFGHNQNLVPPQLSHIQQPLIPSSLPPELRQEYQQQLLQLQKTQESIQRLLLLQQQLKQQQQILQGQAFLPNGIPESEEDKQALHQSVIANAQTLPDLVPEVLVPPQPSGEARPPVYAQQNFHEPQGAVQPQEHYEDYSDRHADEYEQAERTRESFREKEKYVAEVPSGPAANAGENGDDGQEEIQVVYVPAETLAQRGQLKNQRGRDRKQFATQDLRHQRPYNQRGQSSLEITSREQETVSTTASPSEANYAREILQQLQRDHEGTDRLLKEARQKEHERLREERKEIQRQAKLQQAALEREQEIQRQREAEKSRKALEKLEEEAKQQELERIRQIRERKRQEELERSRKAQARANEEKRKQEEARQAELERLEALEKQKKIEIDRTLVAQRELERIQKVDEERAKDTDRSISRQKLRTGDTEMSPQSSPLIRSQQNEQHLTHSGKYNRNNRIRNKPRQRQHTTSDQNLDTYERTSQESSTPAPPSPNQPPLAVFMGSLEGESHVIRIGDVLKTLKDAKTIDVLDNVGQNAPQVFVGPSNLETPSGYAKFDLPYLSSIDNNRVERRVDKLPFFVAPLSFNPPPGYAKIPFPAPHIGSVVVNTLDHIPPSQPDGSLEEVGKSNLNPLIEPNSFLDGSNQGVSYSTGFDSSTTPTYSNYRQEEPSNTPQYQTSPSYSTVEASGPGRGYRFRQNFGEQPSGPGSQEQTHSRTTFQSRPAFQEESISPSLPNHSPQYSEESSAPTTPNYRRPNVVTSFTYDSGPQSVSSTPVYQESYSQIREDSSNRQTSNSQRESPQHREVVQRYQLQPTQKESGQEYSSGQVDSSIGSYEESLRGPTQYNLPAELPPIIPQLPGLVNSLLDEGEQTAFVNRQNGESSTTTTTTTTTEAPTTTVRSRGRHRGRVVGTRSSTTTTTTLSPPSKSRDSSERTTRRPFARSRSRFTTTTEENKETYEPTRAKIADTTERYNAQESYRRQVASKSQKYKSREDDGATQSSRNQVHNVQSHEPLSNERSPVSDSNSRLPEATGLDSNEPVYSPYNFASSTDSLENYPPRGDDGRRTENSAPEVDYSKNLNYQQYRPSAGDNLRSQEGQVPQQYQEQFPSAEFGQPNLEDAPVNGFNYQIRNDQTKTTPLIPPTSRDYAYYQNKQEGYEKPQEPGSPTGSPINPQIQDYQRPPLYENSDFGTGGVNEDAVRPQAQFAVSNDNFGNQGGVTYDPYSRDNQGGLRTTGLTEEQASIEVTTEPTTTTTTTTTTAPSVIRQRVRGRLGGRGRPDSAVQTKSRGSQDEYVRFSAINEKTTTTERPTRQRDNLRSRPKTRPQYNSQVQTEGNDYVRIQAPIRTYQKTIVTPPSTTQRTTTTAPTTTTVDYESNDQLEYGFIRTPNFNSIKPVGNRYQNAFRPTDNQAQLQSIVPTDETAEDSSPDLTQVARNRPKYQSPSRRTTGKVTASTTLASVTSPYTERSRTRIEEPKNNKIRVRGRKPGRRRTTTTTTTTTEYVLEENNDLPLEENYPRRIESIQDPANDKQAFYDEKFEALPLAVGVTGNPVQQQDRASSYASQDFLLNFGSDPGTSDQSQLASNPPRKYGQTGGSRSRTHSTHRGGQDRDIYGAESQWSTKLTSTSFQPSPTANRLQLDDQKSLSFGDNDKTKYSNDEASADAPEIITAAPEDSYVTVLVTSDDKNAKSMSSIDGVSMDGSPMEEMNYGMKTNVAESTTQTSTSLDTFGIKSSTGEITSTESTINGETTNLESRMTRKPGMRRRRVRVRVRPATEDFVTAESQHFNSAFNSLVQDRMEYNRRDEVIKASPELVSITTTETPEIPDKSIFDVFLEDIFKNQNKSNTQPEVTSSPLEISTVSTKTSEFPEFTDITDSQETATINSWKDETTTETYDENLTTTKNSADTSTSAPLMTTMTIPRKSWDSTKKYIDSVAMHSGETFQNPKVSNFDDNVMRQGNEVFENDDRDKTTNSGREEENDDENYPKNHRSEWSEVRYPTDRGLYNYHRQIQMNFSTTQLPGVVTVSEGDQNVKTLSDYVKAIFDTMKNAEEQKSDATVTGVAENFSTTTENIFTTINDATGKLEVSTEIAESQTNVDEKSTEKTTQVPETVETTKIGETTTKVEEGTTEIPTETIPTISTSSEDSEVAESFSTLESVNANSSTTQSSEPPTILTTDFSNDAKNTNQTKLGAILRTSTTTKVSHMTEICYRGRCVMTKPKKEINGR